MKTLYVIDAYAQFFRAYHAIRTPMSSPVTKEPTNATFGFIGMLLKLFTVHKPDYVCVAYDASGDRGTFRSELYPAYKATRDAPPDDFKPQAERCLSILRQMKIPVLGVEGYEADDVIATIAHRIGEQTPGVKVRIVSKDKDLQQLLAPGTDGVGGVDMFDVHTEDHYDVDRLKEEKGVTPAQVIDMLALMGDTSDNVPGVPGIGPKTAAQLIAEFGDLDSIIAEALEDKPKKDWRIKGKRRENIAASAETLPLSRRLVRLVDDVEIDFSLDESETARFDLPALQPILKELNFNRYQDELRSLVGDEAIASSPAPARAQAAEGMLFGHMDEAEAASSGSERRPLDDVNYTIVKTDAQLQELVDELRTLKGKPFAIDTETTALRAFDADLVGVCVSTKANTASYVPVRSPTPDDHLDEKTVLSALGPLLEDPAVKKTGHNLKYDMIVLRKCGVRLRGVANDTMVASYVIDASRSSHSLDALALAELGHVCVPIKDLIGSGKKQKCFDEVPLEDAAPYAAEDADVSLRLHTVLDKRLRQRGLADLFDELELPLIDVLAELEYNGIRVDSSILDEQRERLLESIEGLRADIDDAAPHAFNPDSPKQLRDVLFNKPDDEPPGLGISTRGVRKTKTGHTTDAETLEKLAADPDVESPLPGLIVRYRQLTKLVNTYLVALKDEINPKTGRIHASFNQTVAATGRLSSSDPNLQNIPIRTDIGREIRRAFVAPEGRVLISADYSQIELRLLAHLARDANLIAAFKEGADIHRAVAAQMAGIAIDEVMPEQRSNAKQVNFGIVYGITPFGLARRTGISSQEAGRIIDEYKERFSGITRFLDECIDQAKHLGYVTTILGRRRPIPEIEDRNAQRKSLAERTAINTAVQGSAADLIKLAMVDVHRLLRGADAPMTSEMPSKLANRRDEILMLLQIHDELVFECPEDIADDVAAWVRGRMEGALPIDVPLVVDIGVGQDWYEGK
jgi:DNA polymerase-1